MGCANTGQNDIITALFRPTIWLRLSRLDGGCQGFIGKAAVTGRHWDLRHLSGTSHLSARADLRPSSIMCHYVPPIREIASRLIDTPYCGQVTGRITISWRRQYPIGHRPNSYLSLTQSHSVLQCQFFSTVDGMWWKVLSAKYKSVTSKLVS